MWIRTLLETLWIMYRSQQNIYQRSSHFLTFQRGIVTHYILKSKTVSNRAHLYLQYVSKISKVWILAKLSVNPRLYLSDWEHWFQYERSFAVREINIFTLLTSFIWVSGSESSYHCWRTAGAGEERPQMPDQPFFYLLDCSVPRAHKVRGQLEGWLRKKDISFLLRAPLCEQREGSELLLASSHWPCGQSDGFISASLILCFSHKLRGGEGFRSTSWPLLWWSSDQEQAAAG